uniref:Uncharacterized protein n=1 Tax=Ixodes ricinus TaxID=34613 RepID=A0A147BUH7_IXORI
MGLLLAPGFSCVPRVRSCDDKLQVRARSAHGYSWRCAAWMTREVTKRKPVKVQCRGGVSVRSGSFFEGSHLTLPQLMKFIHPWCQNLPCAVIQRCYSSQLYTGESFNFDFCSFYGYMLVTHSPLRLQCLFFPLDLQKSDGRAVLL